MELNTFIHLYHEFLKECKQKGWMVEVLIEEFGNYLAAIKNSEGIEVQFFIELDLENYVKFSDQKKQSGLNYGVLRQEGVGDLFAKEVLEEFHQYWVKYSQLQKSVLIFYKNKGK